jgi:hypothetical protein
MMHSDHRQDGMNHHDPNSDTLDHQLDAALSKFAAVEPRAGLENRILVNLRIERERAERSWWRWPMIAGLAAAVIVVVLSLAWRSGKPRNIAVHPSTSKQANDHSGTQVATKGGSGPIRPHERTSPKRDSPHAVRRQVAAVAAAPKLARFPSPQPLSEQEKILARYVTKYPEHAALIAQARTEELRRDNANEMRETFPASDQDSKQWNK